ncbi:uncharacterized protein LOC141622574 [Silene latifolia]|uniref:uncharacterized protein LOC141622574 n=1 Tax=Silene latifolia TaxID=37657 RepID=UPI003D76CA3D
MMQPTYTIHKPTCFIQTLHSSPSGIFSPQLKNSKTHISPPFPATMASTTSSLSIPAPKNTLIITPSTISLLSKPNSFRVNCHQSNPSTKPSLSVLKTVAIPGSIIATLASSPWAMAAKQIAESPQEDNRGLALLLPLVPAVGWVLFNILQPALNQINKMRNEKAVIFGLGGLALYSALYVPIASAVEEAVEGEAAASNSGLLPYIVAAAVAFEVILLSTMQSKFEETKH